MKVADNSLNWRWHYPRPIALHITVAGISSDYYEKNAVGMMEFMPKNLFGMELSFTIQDGTFYCIRVISLMLKTAKR